MNLLVELLNGDCRGSQVFGHERRWKAPNGRLATNLLKEKHRAAVGGR